MHSADPPWSDQSRLTALQDLAAAEEEATRKQVALAAAEKSAAKIARDAATAAKDLATTEAREEKRAEGHAEAREGSFKLQECLEASPCPFDSIESCPFG